MSKTEVITKALPQVAKAQESWETEKKEELGKLSVSAKTYPEILMYLENEIEQSKQMTTFDYKVACFKNDGIYQLSRAIEEIVGMSSVQKESGMSAPNSISTVDVQLANGVRKKIPYGKIDLPGMGDDANIDIRYNLEKKCLHVKGTCQFMFQSIIDRIIDKTNELLNTDSIYKSQAFEINEHIDEGQPRIMDLKDIDKEIMILSEETEYAMSPLNARILHTKECIENGISLKYGCLLEGPYGGLLR